MGANNSTEAAYDEVTHVKGLIDRKCNSYVMSVEQTHSVVDITLSGLRKEIFALIEPLRSSKNLVDLGMEDMAAMLEGVEHHANTQKFTVQRLLDIMFEAQTTFEELSDFTMANADVDDVPEVLLDEGCMTSMRLIIENLLYGYEKELKTKKLSNEMVKQRCDELHRLLFKLAEVTVSEMVDSTVAEMKDAFLEDIDNMICLSMMSGEFKHALEAKECLQSIISKSIIARVSLEALPFSRRVEVEAGQDEIEQFVDDLVRKVQMHHSNEETQHFEQLMNMDLDYGDINDEVESVDDEDESVDDEDEGVDEEDEIEDNEGDNNSDNDSTSSDDNSTEPEDTEDDSEELDDDVVVLSAKKPRKSAARKPPAIESSVVKNSPAAAAKSRARASTSVSKKRKDVESEVTVSAMTTRSTRTRTRR